MSKYYRSDSKQGDYNLNESDQFTLKGEDEAYESSPKLDSYKFLFGKNNARSNSNQSIKINNLTNFSFSKHNLDSQEKKNLFNDRKDINKINIIPKEKRYKSIVKVNFAKSKKKIRKRKNGKISKSLPPNEIKENMIFINNENEQNEQNHISFKNGQSQIKETQIQEQKEKPNINDKDFENMIEYISSDEIKSEDMQNPSALDMNFYINSNSKENEGRFLSCEDNYIFYNNISIDKEMPNNEFNIYNNSNDKNEEKIKLTIFDEKDNKKDYNNILSEMNKENKNDDQKITFQNNNNDNGNFISGNDNSNEIEKIDIIYLDIDSGIESIQKEVHNINKDKNSIKKNSLNNSCNISKENISNSNRNNFSNKSKNDSTNDELFIKCKNFLTQIYHKNKEKGKLIRSNSQSDKNNEKNINKKDKDLRPNKENEVQIKNQKIYEEEDKEEIIEVIDERIYQKEYEKEKEKKMKIKLLDEIYCESKKAKEINKIINKAYIPYGKEKEKRELNREEQKNQNINIESQSKNNQFPIYLEVNKNENSGNSINEEIIEIKDTAQKVKKSKCKIKNDNEGIKDIKKEKDKYNTINIKEKDLDFCGIKEEKINMNADKDFFEKIKLQIKKEIYNDFINNNSLSPKSKQNLTKLKKEAIVLKDSDSEEDNKYKNKALLGKKRKRTTLFEIDHSIKFNYISEITKSSEICLNKPTKNNYYKKELIKGNTFSVNDDLERNIIKSIETCALNCIYEKIITKSFSSGIELDRKIMEIIKTRGYSNVKSSLNNFRKNQILSIEEIEKNNNNEIEIDKKNQKEFHYNVINDFYYRYKCINIKQNIQKYVCCAKDCNGLAELNLSEKKFVIIQKHSIPPKFHTKFKYDKPIKFMKKRKLEEINNKRNDNNDKFHMEWFK